MTTDTKSVYSMSRLVTDVDLLTEEQAANAMQMHKGTLRNARCTGTLGLPFIKLTPTKRGKVRYRESDIIAWLEARTHLNTNQACTKVNGGAA